jgi:hypothetical protein
MKRLTIGLAVLFCVAAAGWVATQFQLDETRRQLRDALAAETAAKLEVDIMRRTQRVEERLQGGPFIVPPEFKRDFET